MSIKAPTFSLTDDLRNSALHWGKFIQGIVHLAQALDVLRCDNDEQERPFIKMTGSLLQGHAASAYWDCASKRQDAKKIESNDSRPMLNHAD